MKFFRRKHEPSRPRIRVRKWKMRGFQGWVVSHPVGDIGEFRYETFSTHAQAVAYAHALVERGRDA